MRAGVPTGPSVRKKKWRAQLVGRFVRNPVLKGVLLWNQRVNKRKNLTGKRVAVKADPSDLLEHR
jgi:Recombinase.